MRSPKLIASGTVGINMTPMIDVVFLLIIFFLVTSHVAKQESSVELQLPTARSALDELENRSLVVVNVLPDGSWSVAGATVEPVVLEDILRRRQMEAPGSIQLRIRTDRAVPYEKIEPILGAAARLGIGDVVFSVYEEREP